MDFQEILDFLIAILIYLNGHILSLSFFFFFSFFKLLTTLTCTNEVTWSISCQIDWNIMVHCSHLSFILQKLRLSAKEVIFESIVSLGTLIEKIFHLNSGASDVC